MRRSDAIADYAHGEAKLHLLPDHGLHSAAMVRSICIGLVGIVSIGCGDSPAPTATSESAKAVVTSPPLKPTSSAKLDEMPSLTVDELGPYLNGQRPKMSDPDGPAKLKSIVAGLPIKGKGVTLAILKKAKTTDVVAVVNELGAAGAPTVTIKVGDTRKDLPSELVVTPRNQYTETPPACAVVGIITAKLETDIWAVQGGTAKKHVKGMAGPDLSNAGESLQKDLKKCDAKVAFFTADDTHEWAVTHLIGGAIKVNDTEKKIEKLVLLDEVPVPGRPVKGLSK